jgi:hypothetical protein
MTILHKEFLCIPKDFNPTNQMVRIEKIPKDENPINWQPLIDNMDQLNSLQKADRINLEFFRCYNCRIRTGLSMISVRFRSRLLIVFTCHVICILNEEKIIPL